MSAETLLPGEGEMRTQVCVRRQCDICAAPATVRIGFLLPNCRTNPASTAYGRDDCSWCSDAEGFACDAHKREVEQERPGYRASSWMTLNERFAHLFLTWEAMK